MNRDLKRFVKKVLKVEVQTYPIIERIWKMEDGGLNGEVCTITPSLHKLLHHAYIDSLIFGRAEIIVFGTRKGAIKIESINAAKDLE